MSAFGGKADIGADERKCACWCSVWGLKFVGARARGSRRLDAVALSLSLFSRLPLSPRDQLAQLRINSPAQIADPRDHRSNKRDVKTKFPGDISDLIVLLPRCPNAVLLSTLAFIVHSHHRNVRSFYRRAIFKRRGPLSSARISEKKPDREPSQRATKALDHHSG
jgi:hypothetical protein